MSYTLSRVSVIVQCNANSYSSIMCKLYIIIQHTSARAISPNITELIGSVKNSIIAPPVREPKNILYI